VRRFDHHCKWLNTCVGEHNYLSFLWVIVTVTGITTLSFILNLYLLIWRLLEENEFDERAEESVLTRDIDPEILWGLIVVSTALLFPLLLLVLQLLGFHGMLSF